MGKKYTPSGYQIIKLDVTDMDLSQAFTPRNEDEELLLKCLLKNSFKKPILLHYDSDNYSLCGFVTSLIGEIDLMLPNLSLKISLNAGDNTKLRVEETEL